VARTAYSSVLRYAHGYGLNAPTMFQFYESCACPLAGPRTEARTQRARRADLPADYSPFVHKYALPLLAEPQVNLPPALVHIAELDVLRDEGTRRAAAALPPRGHAVEQAGHTRKRFKRTEWRRRLW
jgi:acetyl esterase/lipase